MEESRHGLILRCYPNISLEGLRNSTQHLSQDNQSPDWYLNPGPPTYETGVLTTWPQRSVEKCYVFFEAQTESNLTLAPEPEGSSLYLQEPI
jgi:hypothetical protein